jgi:hypothetical protein
MRRARKKHGALTAGLFFIGLGVVVAAGYFMLSAAQDPFRALHELEVGQYLENANSLRGNVYKVEGVIDHALYWSPVRGRLFSLQVDGPGRSGRVAVLVPADFNHMNLQKGQRYHIKVEVVEGGVLLARDLRKT